MTKTTITEEQQKLRDEYATNKKSMSKEDFQAWVLEHIKKFDEELLGDHILAQLPNALDNMKADLDQKVKEQQRLINAIKQAEAELAEYEKLPKLKTHNPPVINLVNAKRARILARIFLAVALISGIGMPLLLLNKSSAMFFALPFLFCTVSAVAALIQFQKANSLNAKWKTTYQTLTFSPLLKGGRKAQIEVQIEIPKGWDTPETLKHLENSARPILFDLFHHEDTVPSRFKVERYIEAVMARKQREIGLGICRMDLLTNIDPAMPVFGQKHVCVCNGTIIKYEISDLWRADAVDSKITEILKAHSATDLPYYEDALNVRFIGIEKSIANNNIKGFNG